MSTEVQATAQKEHEIRGFRIEHSWVATKHHQKIVRIYARCLVKRAGSVKQLDYSLSISMRDSWRRCSLNQLSRIEIESE